MSKDQLLPTTSFMSDHDMIKQLFKENFQQQKNELTEELIAALAEVNQAHYNDVERKLDQMDKKIVGWYPFVLGLIITAIASIALSFIIVTWYHEKYLTENKWGRDLRENQANDKGTTRSIKVIPKTDAQIDSEQRERLKSIK